MGNQRTDSARNLCLREKSHMLCLDLPKDYLLKNPKNNIIFIPPVISVETVSGQGEFHHVRSKIKELNKGDNGFFSCDDYITKDKAPWFFVDSEEPFEEFMKNYKTESIAGELWPKYLMHRRKERIMTIRRMYYQPPTPQKEKEDIDINSVD